MRIITMLLASSNELGYIQATTNSDNKEELEALGWIDNISKLKPLPEKKAPKKKAVKKVKADGK